MRFATAFLVTALAAGPASATQALTDDEVHGIVAPEIEKVLRNAGAAVVVRIEGRTLFLNFGLADHAGNRPVTPDALFNLASVSKVFDATLLSLLALEGEVSLDDPVAKYIGELRQGGDIGHVTLGQLATFTSGFILPQDRPPWPEAHFTMPRFLRAVKNWKIDKDHQPGKQYLYSHAGIMLLHVALERRFGVPYAKLLDERLLRRLGLSSTILPARGANSVGMLPPALKRRTVQGYAEDGKPSGKPGQIHGVYHWPGSGQMFSSARDMATFLAAHLGELPGDPLMQKAAALTHQEVVPIEPNRVQAHAWEHYHRGLTIIDKNGGLSNSTTYIGMMPSKRLGLVLLFNRGWLDGREIGQPILLRLARPESSAL